MPLLFHATFPTEGVLSSQNSLTSGTESRTYPLWSKNPAVVNSTQSHMCAFVLFDKDVNQLYIYIYIHIYMAYVSQFCDEVVQHLFFQNLQSLCNEPLSLYVVRIYIAYIYIFHGYVIWRISIVAYENHGQTVVSTQKGRKGRLCGMSVYAMISCLNP